VYSSCSHRARQILPSSLNRQGEGVVASLELEGPLVGLELPCNVMPLPTLYTLHLPPVLEWPLGAIYCNDLMLSDDPL
jgi:hypothetical protein